MGRGFLEAHMTTYIRTSRELIQLAAGTTTEHTPSGHCELSLLKRWRKPLERLGWKISIANEGTNTVQWCFMKQGTKRTVCRVARVTPIAHYPIVL